MNLFKQYKRKKHKRGYPYYAHEWEYDGAADKEYCIQCGRDYELNLDEGDISCVPTLEEHSMWELFRMGIRSTFSCSKITGRDYRL